MAAAAAAALPGRLATRAAIRCLSKPVPPQQRFCVAAACFVRPAAAGGAVDRASAIAPSAADASGAVRVDRSGAFSLEETHLAHMKAFDSVRDPGPRLPPDGSLPSEWQGLEPLPPNTKPPEGEARATSDARRALWRAHYGKQPYCCPACRQPLFRLDVLSRHLRNCCPDLVSAQDLLALDADDQTLRLMLREAAVRETALQQRGDCPLRVCIASQMTLGYRERDEEGHPIRRSNAAVARLMGLPEKRVQNLLRTAMKSIPLRHDIEELDVLYEDDHLIALNKPAGVLTAPKHRFVGGSMVNRLIPYLGYMPRVLHRLDMYTSGVVIFAKTLAATRDVHKQFRQRSVAKTYLAIAAGVPAQDSFSVAAPIDRHATDQMIRVTTSATGRPAQTEVRVLSANAGADLRGGALGGFCGPVRPPDRGAALVRCSPVTGRTHQIRVHLGHVGHPIIGDDFYGVTGPWIGRQALHAASLEIAHPQSGAQICFKAPLLQDFRDAVTALGLECPEEYC